MQPGTLAFVMLPLALSALRCAPGDTAAGEPGVTWSRRWTGNVILSDVVWSGSRFVVIGPGGVGTSQDGLKWKLAAWEDVPVVAEDGGRPGYLWPQSLTWGGSQFVAVGYIRLDPRTDEKDAVILTSPDGVTWTTRRPPGSVGWNVSDVAWSGDRFVAVAVHSQPTFLTSPDGVVWSARRIIVDGYTSAIAWGGAQFVAIGAYRQTRSPLILTSPDGVTWTERTSPDSSQRGGLTDVAWSGRRFVAVGFSTILTSLDGVAWSTQVAPGSGLQTIAWGGSQFVILGYGVFTSPDGITWTRRPARGEFLHGSSGVAWSGTRFVAVGSLRRGWFADYLKGLILTSP